MFNTSRLFHGRAQVRNMTVTLNMSKEIVEFTFLLACVHVVLSFPATCGELGNFRQFQLLIISGLLPT